MVAAVAAGLGSWGPGASQAADTTDAWAGLVGTLDGSLAVDTAAAGLGETAEAAFLVGLAGVRLLAPVEALLAVVAVAAEAAEAAQSRLAHVSLLAYPPHLLHLHT